MVQYLYYWGRLLILHVPSTHIWCNFPPSHVRFTPVIKENLFAETRPDDDVIVSGWGDVDDTREDLLQDWGQMLEEWDGRDRDKPKPSKLIKLCSKVRNGLDTCSCFI